MPGTIIRFLVAEGDSVNEGDCICILEAMKMENEIQAPVAGKVKSVNHGAGDKVGSGDVLAVIG